MTREEALSRIEDPRQGWDVIVIGGGAAGLGTAVDAASRGYHTLLLEQSDFAKATSSRSTKLIHGGFRYLRQGHFSLVLESLRERGRLFQNAPHLVRRCAFVVPNYQWWEAPYYGVGLKLYDLLAGSLGLSPSRHLSLEETLKLLPTLESQSLRGGILYFDAQFDDARLALCLAQTLRDLGGWAVNYVRVGGLIKQQGRVCGVIACDVETGREHRIHARVVVNATGVFTDATRNLDDAGSVPMVTVSQGAHIILKKSFLPGDTALMVPKTDDGRVLFAIPWLDRVLVGTTDTPTHKASLEPRPLRDEIDFLLRHVARYLTKDPSPGDIQSAFAGLRALVQGNGKLSTAGISRAHALTVSESGLVTIAGGKWTIYRKMGEDAVNTAGAVAGLENRPSRTRDLKLHGWAAEADNESPWRSYGTDARELRALIQERREWNESLQANLPYKAGEVIWAVRNEMARTVEDVLARRTRALILDALASIEAAPKVAVLMAAELGRDKTWIEKQTTDFVQLAQGYLLG